MFKKITTFLFAVALFHLNELGRSTRLCHVTYQTTEPPPQLCYFQKIELPLGANC